MAASSRDGMIPVRPFGSEIGGAGGRAVEVKICGLCRPEDAAMAAEAGADYLGVVLAPGYRRTRTVAEAEAIFASGRGAAKVGVFVDAPLDELVAVAERLGLDVLQLHGSESAEYAARVREAGPWRVWKAVRPRTGAEFAAAVARYRDVVHGILVDGWSPEAPGGTGTRFPWAEISAELQRLRGAGPRLIAAGGLTPENVAEAVARLAPDVVDVSSGVERSVGEKDPARVRAFVDAARSGGAGGARGARPQE